MLYLRMFFNMAISLYTSRVVLATLGVEDYGIYNIVGGVVVLFSFIQNALGSATQRFLNYEMGKKNKRDVQEIFCTSMTVHILIAVVICILAETLGLWFFYTQLSIPVERLNAGMIAYQFSVITCCINIIRTPYYASIIANEKMSFFAYVSVFESILRLLIVYLLLISNIDRLILYSILVSSVSFITFWIYRRYCIIKFKSICEYSFIYNRDLIKNILSFSGWSLLVAGANVASTQGINIILNIFKGVTLNAAMGIANQVSNAVYGFVSNFQLAYSPQIIKLYAANELNELHKLIINSSKFSYYLMFIISFPLILCCKEIMEIWLVNVPTSASSFTQIILIIHLFDALSAPLWIAIQATGKIRNYQIIVSLSLILNIPLSIFIFKMGGVAEFALLSKLTINIILLLFRIFYVSRKIKLSILLFIRKVILKCSIITLMALPIPLYIHYIVFNEKNWIFTFILTVFITGCIILLNLEKHERDIILFKLKGMWKKV